MADTSKPKDRRSPPQNAPRGESARGTGSTAEWGAEPPKSGVRGEVKLALMLVMTLAGAFGYIVYRKFDALQQVAAAEEVDATKFKPVKQPGTSKSEEVDLSAPPRQEAEPLFAESASSTTSDPFALSATSSSTSSAWTPGKPAADSSSIAEPRQLEIQTATLVTAVEEPVRAATSVSPPWSLAAAPVRDVPTDLFQPEAASSRAVETTTSAAPPAFPQEFPQSPAAHAEPVFASSRAPDLAPAMERPTPADVPFEPVFSEPAPTIAAADTPAAIATPHQVPSTATTKRSDEPLPFSEPPREVPAATVETSLPAITSPEPTTSPLWTPIETTPATRPTPSIEPATPLALPVTPASEPFAPQAFPAANATASRLPAGQSLTSSISTASPAWTPEPARVNSFPTSSAATVEEQVYTIRPGDNYWSISRNLYGTPRYFDALTEFNRERIPDPSRMQPGSQLLAPPREVLEARYPQLCGLATAAVKSSAAPPAAPVSERGRFTVGPGGQPLYRVGTGDTLTSIAQKHLGRASRWTQVYEMNLDVLPNADTLKPGTVLKLPLDASQVAVTPDAPASR